MVTEASIKTEQPAKKDEEGWIKQLLAILVISLTFILIIMLCIWVGVDSPSKTCTTIAPVIKNATTKATTTCTYTNSISALQDMFKSLLPVISTWVTTVLAFYYAKAGFSSASESMGQLVNSVKDTFQEKLKSTPVVGAMIKRHEMTVVTLDENGVQGVTIESLKAKFDADTKVTRLPILDSLDTIKYLIHQSLIYEFIANESLAAVEQGKTFDLSSYTLQDLLTNAKFSAIATTSFGFVSENSSMADVKSVMDGMSQVQDVFVTKTGSANEPIVGWLTNTTVAQAANFQNK